MPQREPEPITWATNAPSHWPRIQVSPLSDSVPDSEAESDPLKAGLEVKFAAGLIEAFEGTPCGCKLTALCRTRLAAEGLLKIPIEVNDNGTSRMVLIYPRAT